VRCYETLQRSRLKHNIHADNGQAQLLSDMHELTSNKYEMSAVKKTLAEDFIMCND